jgi:hypothetical protein
MNGLCSSCSKAKKGTMCSACSPTLEELTRIVFALKSTVEKQQREISELRARPPDAAEDIAEVPTLTHEDLLCFFESDLGALVRRHRWRVQNFNGKLVCTQGGALVPVTEAYLTQMQKDIRGQLLRLLVAYNAKLGADPQGIYPLMSKKIGAMTFKDLKKAFL